MFSGYIGDIRVDLKHYHFSAQGPQTDIEESGEILSRSDYTDCYGFPLRGAALSSRMIKISRQLIQEHNS